MRIQIKIRAVAIIATLLMIGLAPASAAPATPYRVRLPASTREARSAIAAAGHDIEAVGPGWVSIITSYEELRTLRAEGVRILSAEPLDFPPPDAAYTNYAELTESLRQTAQNHATIVRVGSIGRSLEGREIPVIKISDDPLTDDADEPAVLFMALTHAREHLSVEMALAIVKMFTEGYGVDPLLTQLVNEREIYVLPNANPDGGEHDIKTGNYVYWRKNRRPNGDGSYGVDLNRNYGYQWGCCGGSSAFPDSELYRGTAPFSEPETAAVRDFVLAHPDISVAISFHTYGELILYPYGYTYQDQPAGMPAEELATYRSLAQRMSTTNGYRAQQASDLYITSGDTVDWLYGERGIFAFTFEMFPVGPDPGFYPPASIIERETTRNLAAVIYLTQMADQPQRAAWGKTYVPLVAK